jgi:hypothetical protein
MVTDGAGRQTLCPLDEWSAYAQGLPLMKVVDKKAGY